MGKKKKKNPEPLPNKHHLYEASVQDTGQEIDLFTKWFKNRYKKPLRKLREDFSGTGAFACDFAAKHKDNRAWAVDLDPETLEWGKTFHGQALGPAQSRVQFVLGDVRSVRTPLMDHINALNFSYNLFKTRQELLRYFSSCYDRLKKQGLLVVDVFGGTESQQTKIDKRRVDPCTLKDGTQLKKFTYYWHQQSFNPVTYEIFCGIHFKYPGHKKVKNVFTYDWRLWPLPEIQELLQEAGFQTDVYVHDFDEDGESDEIYRRRTKFDNAEGWVAYVAAWKS